MTCLQLDKDFNLICLLLFLSNIIALSYDKRENIIFLSRVEILIHHKKPCVYTTNSYEFKGRKLFPIASHAILNFILSS